MVLFIYSLWISYNIFWLCSFSPPTPHRHFPTSLPNKHHISFFKKTKQNKVTKFLNENHGAQFVLDNCSWVWGLPGIWAISRCYFIEENRLFFVWQQLNANRSLAMGGTWYLPPLCYAVMLCGLSLCMSCACCHSLGGFISTFSLLCL